MQRLLKFKLNRECREIAVNPAKVLYVSHYENGASALHFSKDCYVRVQGELDEVSGKIEAALCGGTGTTIATRDDDAPVAKIN